MYLLTVSLYKPNCWAIPRMYSPFNSAPCTAFDLVVCGGAGFLSRRPVVLWTPPILEVAGYIERRKEGQCIVSRVNSSLSLRHHTKHDEIVDEFLKALTAKNVDELAAKFLKAHIYRQTKKIIDV